MFSAAQLPLIFASFFLCLFCFTGTARAQRIVVANYGNDTCGTEFFSEPLLRQPSIVTSGACTANPLGGFYMLTNLDGTTFTYLSDCALANCTECGGVTNATFGECVPGEQNTFLSAWILGSDTSFSAAIYTDGNCSSVFPGTSVHCAESGRCSSTASGGETTYFMFAELLTPPTLYDGWYSTAGESLYMYLSQCQLGCTSGCVDFGIGALNDCSQLAENVGVYLKVVKDTSCGGGGLEGWEIALIVIGAVVGALVVVALIILAIVIVYRRSGYEKVN